MSGLEDFSRKEGQLPRTFEKGSEEEEKRVLGETRGPEPTPTPSETLRSGRIFCEVPTEIDPGFSPPRVMILRKTEGLNEKK